MLTQSPVVRSVGSRAVFLASAFVSIAMLLWMHQMRLGGELHGLTTIFFVLFTYQDYGAVICILMILAIASVVPVLPWIRRVVGWFGVHPYLVAAATAICLAVGALVVYQNHPLSMDEYSAVFQSKVFAAGHLTGTLPLPLMDWLIPPGFQDYFLNVSHVDGRVASAYWPSFSLILAPFTWAGIPWACNPVITALTLVAIHRLALAIFADTEAAGTALLLTIASPVIGGIGISYYSMPAHLLANTVFALLLLRPTPGRAFVAGVVGSIALTLHNPVPHILFAIPWLLWILSRNGRMGLLAGLGAGYLPLCVLLGIGWFWLSGQLTHAGVTAAANSATAVQHFSGAFVLPDATVLLARVIGIAKIWAWAVPGLLVLACAGAARARKDTGCQLLCLSALLTLIGYCFVPADQGHGWGYRYFHSAWMALPLLATAALYLPASLRIGGAAASTPNQLYQDADTRSFLGLCALLSLVIGVGFRAWQMHDFMVADLNFLPHYSGTERRVVILDPTMTFYGGDLVQNDPWLRGNETRMFTHGRAADAQMMARYYPDLHPVYADHYGWVWSAKVSKASEHDTRTR